MNDCKSGGPGESGSLGIQTLSTGYPSHPQGRPLRRGPCLHFIAPVTRRRAGLQTQAYGGLRFLPLRLRAPPRRPSRSVGRAGGKGRGMVGGMAQRRTVGLTPVDASGARTEESTVAQSPLLSPRMGEDGPRPAAVSPGPRPQRRSLSPWTSRAASEPPFAHRSAAGRVRTGDHKPSARGLSSPPSSVLARLVTSLGLSFSPNQLPNLYSESLLAEATPTLDTPEVPARAISG